MYLHKLFHQFKVLVDEQSFTRASDKLCISQPTLTLNIQRLEEHLCVKLLVRHKKELLLTHIGENLYKHACLLERNYNQAIQELDYLRKVKRYTVTLFCGYAWTHGKLFNLLDDYLKKHAELKVVLKNVTSDGGQTALMAGLCDIVLGAIPPVEQRKKELNYVAIFNTQFVLFCSASHPLARERFVTHGQLEASDWIMLRHEDRENNPDPYRYPCHTDRIRFEVFSVASAISLTRASECLIMLPVQLQSEVLRQGLVALKSEFEFQQYETGLMFTDEALLQQRKKDLIDTIISLKLKFSS
ncbi:LysR family transcriptional regulator [Enterobacter sp.]|uniref:LysR substrate-binding domain-containing protein n=1 Tax=Enterobacter sp. TaxID=42895 RepID=UPI002981283B|nr:LysR family transcriptional regulator [Enterobacter sp.]